MPQTSVMLIQNTIVNLPQPSVVLIQVCPHVLLLLQCYEIINWWHLCLPHGVTYDPYIVRSEFQAHHFSEHVQSTFGGTCC